MQIGWVDANQCCKFGFFETEIVFLSLFELFGFFTFEKKANGNVFWLCGPFDFLCRLGRFYALFLE